MTARTGFAQTMLRNRRERDRLLGEDLFVDPAWDVLLELHAAETEGRLTHESDLGDGANLTHDVARRWVQVLEMRGLVSRHQDGVGPIVTLTGEARRRLDTLIGKWE